MSDFRQFRQRFAVLVGGTLMAVAGVGLISPILPTVQATFGLSDFQSSALIWGYLAPGIVLAPLIGYVADRWGRRRVLIASLILFGVAGGLCATVSTFTVLLVARVVQGVGGVSLPLMARTLIGDYYLDQSGRYMGYHDAWLSMGGAFFPVIGGVLGNVYWWIPFVVYVMAIPTGLAAFFLIPARDFQSDGEGPVYLSRLTSALFSSTFAYLLGCIFLVFVLKYGFMHTALPFLIDSVYGLGSGWIGLAVGLMGLSVAVVSASQGLLRSMWTRSTLITMGFASYGLGLVVSTQFHHPVWLVAGIVLAGIGHGLLLPTINTAIVRFAELKLRASAMSVRKIFVRGGQTVGSPLLAWTGQSWGYGYVVYGTGFIVIGLALLLFVAGMPEVD